jgi:ABC-type uncharacterized transport system permease subunit
VSAPEEPEARAVTPASRLAGYVRGGGVIVPLLTTVLAFLIGGLVMLVTGKDPIATYNAIWKGTGLQWVFPWTTGADRTLAASNLQQTLIITTPLILTGLAVAFAFRAGLFNIGGNGQYIVGAIGAVWVGSSFAGMPHLIHAVLAIAAACVAGAAWAAIAGFLKAATGAHEVISTIMLNWIAVWVGIWLFALGGPLQNSTQKSIPVSNDVAGSAKLPVFWGDPVLQGLHIGIFVALFAVLVFWFILNRSTTGFEVRAVGFNPQAARYSGMSVGKNYVLVMAVCGLFAGLAGAMNTAVGTVAAALLFGALLSGTSQRNLDPTIFEPSLAQNLTYIIQGLVILIVSADVLVLSLVKRGRGIFRRGSPARAPTTAAPTPAEVER